MPQQPILQQKGANYASAVCGAISEWGDFRMMHPRRGEIEGKTFLGQLLALDGMEISLNQLPAGVGIPFLHGHKQNEELYLVITGRGEMQVDGERIPLEAGSAIRVSPAGLRTLRNTGQAPLDYIVIQAKAGSLEQATAQDGFIPDRPVVWE